MNIKPKILILFLIFIISITNVYSITDDFIVVADKYKVDVCRCGVAENIIKIGNTGSIDNVYSIYQGGEAEQFSILSETLFSLDGGKVKEIADVINVPCDVKTGEYELETYVSNAFGLKKVLRQIVDVKKCVIRIKINKTTEEEEIKEDTVEEEVKGIEISLPKRKDDVCSCEKTLYKVVLKSEKKESITVGLSGPEWVKLGWTKAVELNENDEFSFDLIVEPGCNETGKEEVQLIAKNSKGLMADKTSIILDVVPQEKCNKIKILTDEIVVNRNESKAEIEIKNLGERKEEYEIIVEGDEWAATKTTIELEGGENKNIVFDLSLDETVDDGKYKIKVSARKENNTIYSKDVDLIIGEKKFDFASFLLSLLAVLIIVGLIIAAIALIYKREREETEDVRIEEIEEETQKKSSKNARAEKKKRK